MDGLLFPASSVEWINRRKPRMHGKHSLFGHGARSGHIARITGRFYRFAAYGNIGINQIPPNEPHTRQYMSAVAVALSVGG